RRERSAFLSFITAVPVFSHFSLFSAVRRRSAPGLLSVFQAPTACGGCPPQPLPPPPCRHSSPGSSQGQPPLSHPLYQRLLRGLLRPYLTLNLTLPAAPTSQSAPVLSQKALPLPLSLSLTAAVRFPASAVSPPLSFLCRIKRC